MDEEIKKEIENLREQARHNERTGFHELAEKQIQCAEWLQELLELRSASDYICDIHGACSFCDAYNYEIGACVFGKGEK